MVSRDPRGKGPPRLTSRTLSLNVFEARKPGASREGRIRRSLGQKIRASLEKQVSLSGKEEGERRIH